MKFRQLISVMTFLLLVSPAYAVITTDEADAREYLINYGYSTQMADVVQREKAQILNTPYKKKTKYNSLIKKFFKYIDPGMDDGLMETHDIKPGSSYFDY